MEITECFFELPAFPCIIQTASLLQGSGWTFRDEMQNFTGKIIPIKVASMPL